MFRRQFLSALSLILLTSAPLAAREIHVDPDRGNDSADGAEREPNSTTGPVRTIARAVKLAQPGDTVHLANTGRPYRESPVFHNRHGEPGKPITLDGHGATIEGCDPLVTAEWEQVSPSLYRKARLLRTDDAVLGRWFMRFAGKMQHMERTSKGPSKPLKAPSQLQPGEWTYIKDSDMFYVKVSPDQSLADARIEAPMRSSGVQISGDCAHLVIRNLICTHVYNDGFNIHGKTRDVRFEKVQAIECGDDGISAHDDCRIEVDQFVSIGNSTGMCHTNESHTDCRRVFVRDCLGFDYFMVGGGEHRLKDSLLICSSAGAVRIVGDTMSGAVCQAEFDNVAIQRLDGRTEIVFAIGSQATLRQVSLNGFGIAASGKSLHLFDSVIAGSKPPEVVIYPGVKWQANGNRYDIRLLRFDKRFVTRELFNSYQNDMRQDASSRWETARFREPFDGTVTEQGNLKQAGVDSSRLPKSK